MMHPTWADSEQGDLLELVARGSATGAADAEWPLYVEALHDAADEFGVIYPNVLRPLTRGRIAPRRISAFTSRALARKVIAYTGEWQISDDREGRNAGRPQRVMRLL
jgi:hypothetical protein